MTSYIVFCVHEPAMGETNSANGRAALWREVGRVGARSSRAAITQLLGEKEEPGMYVAVPARSFKPFAVEVETKTALKFS